MVEPRRLPAGPGLEMLVWAPASPHAPHAGRPLLLFSHGYLQEPEAGGDLARRLAERGWLAGAPRHCDGRSGEKAADAPALRRAELVAAARALADFRDGGAGGSLGAPASSPALLRDRVVLAGHSLGGATCLELAALPPEESGLRVQALLLLSPALYTLEAPDFARVRAPALLLYGEKERGIRGWSPKTKAELASEAYEHLGGPCHLFELTGAGHYSFTARSGIGPLSWLRRGSRRHLDLTAELAGAFLDRYMGDGGAEGGSALAVDGRFALRRERP